MKNEEQIDKSYCMGDNNKRHGKRNRKQQRKNWPRVFNSRKKDLRNAENIFAGTYIDETGKITRDLRNGQN